MSSDLNVLLNENMTRVTGGWQCRLCQKIDTKEINQNRMNMNTTFKSLFKKQLVMNESF